RASYLGLPIVPLVHQAMYRDVPHMTSSKRFIYGGIISAFRELPHGLSGIGGARVLAAKGMLPAVTWVSLPAALVLGVVVQPCSLRRRAELLAAVSLLASLPPAVSSYVVATI